MLGAAFSPNGKLLASAGADGTVRLSGSIAIRASLGGTLRRRGPTNTAELGPVRPRRTATQDLHLNRRHAHPVTWCRLEVRCGRVLAQAMRERATDTGWIARDPDAPYAADECIVIAGYPCMIMQAGPHCMRREQKAAEILVGF